MKKVYVLAELQSIDIWGDFITILGVYKSKEDAESAISGLAAEEVRSNVEYYVYESKLYN
jgi:septal ring-binding cell division protein DamX